MMLQRIRVDLFHFGCPCVRLGLPTMARVEPRQHRAALALEGKHCHTCVSWIEPSARREWQLETYVWMTFL